MGLEARISDDEAVSLFSQALDCIVYHDSVDKSDILSQNDTRELYKFISNYFQNGGTVVTASDLKKKFDEKLTPVFNDYLFRRYHTSIERHKAVLSYGLIPACGVVLGVGAGFLGFEKVSATAFGVAVLGGLAWLGGFTVADLSMRSARRNATANASEYFASLPVERFEHLLSRAAKPYSHLFMERTRV